MCLGLSCALYNLSIVQILVQAMWKSVAFIYLISTLLATNPPKSARGTGSIIDRLISKPQPPQVTTSTTTTTVSPTSSSARRNADSHQGHSINDDDIRGANRKTTRPSLSDPVRTNISADKRESVLSRPESKGCKQTTPVLLLEDLITSTLRDCRPRLIS